MRITLVTGIINGTRTSRPIAEKIEQVTSNVNDYFMMYVCMYVVNVENIEHHSILLPVYKK